MNQQTRRSNLAAVAALSVTDRPVQTHAAANFPDSCDSVSHPELENVFRWGNGAGQPLAGVPKVGMRVNESG